MSEAAGYQVAHIDDVGLVFLDPVLAGQAAIEESMLHITAHLLGADEPAIEFRVIDGRAVTARTGRDFPTRFREQVLRGFLKATLWQPEHQERCFFGHAPDANRVGNTLQAIYQSNAAAIRPQTVLGKQPEPDGPGS